MKPQFLGFIGLYLLGIVTLYICVKVATKAVLRARVEFKAEEENIKEERDEEAQ